MIENENENDSRTAAEATSSTSPAAPSIADLQPDKPSTSPSLVARFSSQFERRSGYLKVRKPNADEPPTDLDGDRDMQEPQQVHEHIAVMNTSTHSLASYSSGTSSTFFKDMPIIDWVNDRVPCRHMFGGDPRSSHGFEVYFLLMLTGFCIGVIAIMLDATVEWLDSIKHGLCWEMPYLTRDMCCEHAVSYDTCDAFYTWSNIADHFRFFSASAFWNGLGFLGFALLFGFLASTFVVYIAPFAAGSGIAEVKAILSGVKMDEVLQGDTLIVKVVGLALAVASGLNLGKEGPFVHLAACVGFGLTQLLYRLRSARVNQIALREIITSSTAAGIAVAFDAPIAGVLFALEEASSYFEGYMLWRTLFCAVMGALTLTWLRPYFNAPLITFQIESGDALSWHWFEMIPYMTLGALGGVLGVLLIEINVRWSMLRLRRSWFQKHPIQEVLALILVTVLINYLVDVYVMNNSQLLLGLFQTCLATEGFEDSPHVHGRFLHSKLRHIICALPHETTGAVLILLYGAFTKLLLTALTIGSKVPAGLFVPSLTIGALFGRAMGTCMQYLAIQHASWPIFQECTTSSVCVEPAFYATVGAASMLAGVTQGSVSLVIIVFEVTGESNHLLPIMMAVLFSKMACYALHARSIYLENISLKRYPFFPMDLHFRAFRNKEQISPVSSIHSTEISKTDADGERTEISPLLSGASPSVSGQRSSSGRGLVSFWHLDGSDIERQLETPPEQTLCTRIMEADLKVLPASGWTLGRIQSLITHWPFHGYPVVLESNSGDIKAEHLVGYITRDHLNQAIAREAARRHIRGLSDDILVSFVPKNHDFIEITAATKVINWNSYMDEFVPMILASTTMHQMYNMFRAMGIRYVLVIDKGRLVGLVSKKDLISYIEEIEFRGQRLEKYIL